MRRYSALTPRLTPYVTRLLIVALLLGALVPVRPTLGAAPAAPAALDITRWDFEGQNLVPALGFGTALHGSGLSGEAFYAGNNSSWAWSFSGWTTRTLDLNDYYEFDAGTAGYRNIRFSFGERRSGTGIRTFELHYSIDGTSFTPFSTTQVPNDTNWRTHTYDLSGITGLNDNPNAKFRLYGYGASSNSGTWRVDDVAVAGDVSGSNQPIAMTCGGPFTVVRGRGGSHTVSARDPDGTVSELTLLGVTPPPPTGTITLVNVIPAPGTGLTATGQLTVTRDVPVGLYSAQVRAQNNDPTPQAGACTTVIQVVDALMIGQVQGTIPDNLPNPFTYPSPYVGQQVILAGVVTDRMLTRSGSTGTVYYHFYLQERPENSDGDPYSSDGIHVYLGINPSFNGYRPLIGDEITVRGTVSEYYNDTELTSPAFLGLSGHVGNLDQAVPPVPITPTGTLTETGRLWERVEGMRVRIPAGAPIVAPTHLYVSSGDTEFYVIRPDHPVAQRPDPYTRRVFRDGHPLDWGGNDDNPWRISIEAQVLKGNANNPDLQLPPARTYDVVSDTLRGPVVYAYSRYTVNVEDMPVLRGGVDPLANYTPQQPDRWRQYTAATFNVENLYDYLNDPFDGCDFQGDPGCPGVNPPFDYVPASVGEYQTHVIKLARGILDALHAPDVLVVQEAEDQDICVGGGQLYGVCGQENNADGRPDVLQDLAQQVYFTSGGVISYAVTLDRVGADERGITVGFLWRTDRVTLPAATPGDPLLGLRPTDPYSNTYPHNTQVLNPKGLQATYSGGGPLFSRTPQVARFDVYRTVAGVGDYVPLYVIGNHFKSTPDQFVQLRTEEAQYNAELVSELLAAQPGAQALVGGDLNVYPDSPQLASLYTDMSNFYYAAPPVANFSYVYTGQTQTLDQLFATTTLSATAQLARYAHFDADYPYSLRSDPRTFTGVSDHDPLLATFNLPPVQVLFVPAVLLNAGSPR